MKPASRRGQLTYTWARRGQQPKVKTSGKRKGYKVFGLIEYFTGRFFYQGQEGRSILPRILPFSGVCWSTQPNHPADSGWRTVSYSAETKAFFAQQTARLQVVQLPTYSPDYNPIEKLWKKIKQQETHLHTSQPLRR